jgi:hypothetical protein
MSSSNLFNIAGSIFAVLPVGHTIFYRDIIVPGLKPSGASEGAYASKVSWNQANGYFITTGIQFLSPHNCELDVNSYSASLLQVGERGSSAWDRDLYFWSLDCDSASYCWELP